MEGRVVVVRLPAAAPAGARPSARRICARGGSAAAPSHGHGGIQPSSSSTIPSRCPAGAPLRPAAAARCPRAAAAAASAEPASLTPLQAFLSWLVANGVEGVGTPGTKMGLYEGESGERGLVATADIVGGEKLATIPLHIAIVDAPGPGPDGAEAEAAAAGVYAGAPWSVRLATKLLRLVAQGGECPWYPYLAALVRTPVPSPLGSAWAWADVRGVQHPPAAAALAECEWLAATAWRRLSGGAPTAAAAGGAGEAAFRWALALVHSRTFGAAGGPAAPGGAGVGVRMLVPLADMLNHRGDELVPLSQLGGALVGTTAGAGLAPPRSYTAEDNVRWDVVPKLGGEWVMVLSATRDVQPGEELALSYGERANDDFVLHYGFCPPRNAHDAVALFHDLSSAVDWALDAYVPLGALPPAALQAAVVAAYAAAEAQERDAKGGSGGGRGDGSGGAAAAAPPAAGEQQQEAPSEEAATAAAAAAKEAAAIKLSPRGMVDGRLLAALTALHPYAVAAAEARGGAEGGGGGGGSGGGATPVPAALGAFLRAAVARRAREMLADMPRGLGATGLTADLAELAAAEAAGECAAAHDFEAAAAYYAAAIARAGEADPPPRAPAAAAAAAAAGADGGGGAAPFDAGAAAAADAALLAALRRAGGAPPPAAVLFEDAEEQEQGGRQAGRNLVPLIFRAYKKMLLWDAVLAQ